MARKRTLNRTPRKRSRTTKKGSPFYRNLLPEVTIYTDGSASHTSRWGGWSFIIIFPDGFEIARYGNCSDTTNNAMELMAAAEGMKYFKSPKRIKLVSDSAYLVNTLALKWWKDWEERGFIGRNGQPTPNKELWQELIDLSKFHIIEPIKIKGHSGDVYNERCDKLAKRARKAAQLGVDPDVKQVNRVSKRPSRRWQLSQKG
jgi:ribonuclease HI